MFGYLCIEKYKMRNCDNFLCEIEMIDFALKFVDI